MVRCWSARRESRACCAARGRHHMNLTACVFDGADDARRAAQRIERAGISSPAECRSWAVVRWDLGGRLPRPDGSMGNQHRSATTAWFWALLLGMTFGVPALGAQLGSASGLEPGTLTAAGIHDSFMNRLRDEVTPGRSALLVLTDLAGTPALQGLIRQPGVPVVAHVHFTPRQEAALLDVLS